MSDHVSRRPVAAAGQRQRGFALIIALSLMALLVLVVVTLSSKVRLETQAVSREGVAAAARQNALLGAMVGLGEVQKQIGPDRRVTANAALFDADPATDAVDGVANPLWLASFPATRPGAESAHPEAQRSWATDRTAPDRVGWLVSSRTDLSDGSADPVSTSAVDLNGGTAGLLVEMAAYEDAAGNPLTALAGKVDVDGNAAEGRFAWWVADESQKARVDATLPETVTGGAAFEERQALRTAPWFDTSLIADAPAFAAEDLAQDGSLDRLGSAEDLALIDPGWSDWLDDRGYALTARSLGLPVDVTQGRLKQDLSVFLDSDSSGLSGDQPVFRGGPGDAGYRGPLEDPSFAPDFNDEAIPRFAKLKDWHGRGTGVSGFAGGAVEPRRADARSAGLHPVVMRAAVHFTPSFQVEADGTVRLAFLIYPKFVLWNPHNVPLEPARYAVQVRAFTTLNIQTNEGGRNVAARNLDKGFNYRGNVVWGDDSFGHVNLAHPTFPEALERDPEDGFPYLTFVIDNDGFAPGETLLYTAGAKHPNSEYVDTPITHFEGNTGSGAVQAHNLLENENYGPIGFFYLPAAGILRPLSNDDPPILDPTLVTEPGDRLRAALYFRDTQSDSPTGGFEPSLTTKLYLLAEDGEVELLQTIDLQGASPDHQDTPVDWEHINSEGWSAGNDPLDEEVTFRSIDTVRADPFAATYHWGHGFYLRDFFRNRRGHGLHRMNPAAAWQGQEDPAGLKSYVASLPTANWYNGSPFPAAVPGELEYAGVLPGAGYDTLGGYGLMRVHTELQMGGVYPLLDPPRAETGLLSLGELSNANLGLRYWQPFAAAGNSQASPYVAREQVAETRGGTEYHDFSWLLNHSLWDRFFLSTIPQDGDFPVAADTRLPQARHRLVPGRDGIFPAEGQLRNSPAAFDQAAAHVGVEGAFNVNSVSVDAWTALLSSLLGQRVGTADGSPANAAAEAPFTRRAFPLLSAADPGDPDTPEALSGLRALRSEPVGAGGSEIERLAAAIVAEVKRRGPFLSLADFVNRRLVPDGASAEEDWLGLKGPLQAAIDRLSLAGEGLLNEEYHRGDFALAPGDLDLDPIYPEHETGVPDGETGSAVFGISGYFTQADLLAALGPLLAVRGDTFAIRAYGEAPESAAGDGRARSARCEMLVQRVAEPVAEGDSLVAPDGPFGRRFVVQSYRWLPPEG